jgi:hypothetical protein
VVDTAGHPKNNNMQFNITLDERYNSEFPIKLYWKPLFPDLNDITEYTLIGSELSFEINFGPEFYIGYDFQIVVLQNDNVIYLENHKIE